MIKNVVFDIGNVIWKGRSSIILEKLNLSEEEKRQINNTFFRNTNLLDKGMESIEEHFNKCPSSITDNKKIKKSILEYYKYRDFNLNIIELIHKLKENGYNIYILSNNNKEAMEYLKQAPEVQCIDGWVVSCDYGIIKPEKEIYEVLFDEFNIKPKESFFIDDMERNINAAKGLGMNGYVLKNAEKGIEGLIDYMRLCKIKI